MSDAVKELREKLFYEKKNGLLKVDDSVIDSMQKYCEGYKAYLDAAKTEREAVATAIAMAEEKGFVPFVIGQKYNAGDRVYFNNRGKTVAFAVIGKESADKGINITAAHVDSPRLDLKPNPLYEELELSFLERNTFTGRKTISPKEKWTIVKVTKKMDPDTVLLFNKDKKVSKTMSLKSFEKNMQRIEKIQRKEERKELKKNEKFACRGE